MVLHQHSRQSRRRGAGRSAGSSGPRKRPSPRLSSTFCKRKLYPDLYKDFYHKVRINYYPPRGDAKEGWDNIDIFGWLGYPMQIKIDFLCRDSILAAPLVLDLVLFMDLAQRAGMRGIQEWLSFYFKAPMHAPELYPEHDIFIQLMKLKNTLALDAGRRPDHASGLGILRLIPVSFEDGVRARFAGRRSWTVRGSMKVLVIGGTLFIGRQLVEELVKGGHEIADHASPAETRFRPEGREHRGRPQRRAGRARRSVYAPLRRGLRQRLRLGARYHGRTGGSHRARRPATASSATSSFRASRPMATA